MDDWDYMIMRHFEVCSKRPIYVNKDNGLTGKCDKKTRWRDFVVTSESKQSIEACVRKYTKRKIYFD